MVRSTPGLSGLRIFTRVFAAVALASAGQAAQSPPSDGYSFYVAPHSHMDVVWYWTYDQTTVVSMDILNHALDLFHRDPRFTFTQDQMVAIEPFWNSLANSEKEFLRR